MRLRYNRAKLAERHWHKIVIHDLALAKLPLLKRTLERNIQGDGMIQGSSAAHVVMLTDFDDVIMVQLAVGFPADAYRGYGDWFRKTYNSAETNRILPTDKDLRV